MVEDGRGRRGEASYTLAQGWSPVPGNSLRVTWTRGTVLRSGAVLRFTVSEKKKGHDLVGALPLQQQPHLLPQPSLLVELPHELWHMVCSFFLRSNWPV